MFFNVKIVVHKNLYRAHNRGFGVNKKDFDIIANNPRLFVKIEFQAVKVNAAPKAEP